MDQTLNPEHEQKYSKLLLEVQDDNLKELSMEQTLQLLKKVTNNKGMQQVLKKVEGKHVIFLIGNSGEGKSTLVNALSGRTLKWTEVNGCEQVVCENEIAKIGTAFKSLTLLPEVFKIGQKIIIGDCPGTNDDRHMVIRLANIINIVRIFEKVQSSSILIVLSIDNINANRGQSMNDLEKMINQFLGGEIETFQNQNAIKINITKWDPSSKRLNSFDKVLQRFVAGEFQDSFRVRMKERGNIFCCNVLKEQGKGMTSIEDFNQMLSEIGSVKKNHLLKYRIYLDEKVMVYLKNMKNYFENKIKTANSSLKAISSQMSILNYLEQLQSPQIKQMMYELDRTIVQVIRSNYIQKSLRLASEEPINSFESQKLRQVANSIQTVFSHRPNIIKDLDQKVFTDYNLDFQWRRSEFILTLIQKKLNSKAPTLKQSFEEVFGHYIFITEKNFLSENTFNELKNRIQVNIKDKIRSIEDQIYILTQKTPLDKDDDMKLKEDLKQIFENLPKNIFVNKENYIKNMETVYQNKKSSRFVSFSSQKLSKIHFDKTGFARHVNDLYDEVKSFKTLSPGMDRNVKEFLNSQLNEKFNLIKQNIQKKIKEITEKQFEKFIQTLDEFMQIQKEICTIPFIKDERANLISQRESKHLLDFENNLKKKLKVDLSDQVTLQQIKKLYDEILRNLPNSHVKIQQIFWDLFDSKFQAWEKQVSDQNRDFPLSQMKKYRERMSNYVKSLRYCPKKQLEYEYNRLMRSIQKKKEKLLSERIQISFERDNNHQILYVKGKELNLGLNDVYSQIIMGWSQKRTVVFIAAKQIEINNSFRLNTNLVLLAPEIVSRCSCRIDLSGHSGRNGLNGTSYEGKEARSGDPGQNGRNGYGSGIVEKSGTRGTNGEDGFHGNNGGNGGDGGDGTPSGNLFIVTDRFINSNKVEIILNGGDGGNGGNGGDGQAGGKGGSGGRGGHGKPADGIIFGAGGKGGKGGNGGDGGQGGNGGNGGASGKNGEKGNMFIWKKKFQFLEVQNSDGKVGDPGRFGKGGGGGQKGMGGQAGAGASGNLLGPSADPSQNGKDGNSGADGRIGKPGTLVQGLTYNHPPYQKSIKKCVEVNKTIYQNMVKLAECQELSQFLQ